MNKNLTKAILLICSICIVLVTIITGNEQVDGEIEYVIGVSSFSLEDPWQLKFVEELHTSFGANENVNVVVKDGRRNLKKQFDDIQDFYASDIDLLVISPYDIAMLDNQLQKINEEVPIIVVDQTYHNYNCEVEISMDNQMIGKKIAETIFDFTENKGGKILEIAGGIPEARMDTIRLNMHNALSVAGEYEIYTVPVNSEAENVVAEIDDKLPAYDVVVTYNDPIAYEVQKELANIKSIREIFVITIDDFTDSNNLLVDNHLQNATIVCNSGAKSVYDYAMELLQNDKKYHNEKVKIGCSIS